MSVNRIKSVKRHLPTHSPRPPLFNISAPFCGQGSPPAGSPVGPHFTACQTLQLQAPDSIIMHFICFHLLVCSPLSVFVVVGVVLFFFGGGGGGGGCLFLFVFVGVFVDLKHILFKRNMTNGLWQSTERQTTEYLLVCFVFFSLFVCFVFYGCLS